MSPRSANRDKAVFGQDANEFRIDRWADVQEAKRMEPLLCTFGAGNRGCLGRNLATVEINLFVAQMLRQFDLHSAVGAGQPMYRNRSQWFNSQENFLVRLERRVL